MRGEVLRTGLAAVLLCVGASLQAQGLGPALAASQTASRWAWQGRTAPEPGGNKVLLPEPVGVASPRGYGDSCSALGWLGGVAAVGIASLVVGLRYRDKVCNDE
jgi:hypothetical protein